MWKQACSSTYGGVTLAAILASEGMDTVYSRIGLGWGFVGTVECGRGWGGMCLEGHVDEVHAGDDAKGRISIVRW